MIPLEIFNIEQAKKYPNGVPATRNNIVCPKCGAELYDTVPDVVLASYPPQKNVHCECGFKGYRIA